ncbi:MAG: RedB protein [Acidobacteria bacterium]|nr:RedB protein [Acidobacteriota bacterium]
MGGITLWAGVLCIGVKLTYDYSTAPGPQGTNPGHWPAASRLSPTPGLSTLVMFVHPKCPCTRASLSELNIIMNSAHPPVAATVVFLRPEGVDDGWERTDTWEFTGTIPGAARYIDADGVEAARFGAETSGQVVLYDSKGDLAFTGGITDSRGHAGNNVGRQTVLALLDGRTSGEQRHAVFGCSLRTPDRERQVAGSGRP